MTDVPIPEPPDGIDEYKLQNPDDEADERERAVKEDFFDKSDRLYQAWKEGDL